MWIPNIFLCIYGLCAGGVIAISYMAFISMIGIVQRLATSTKSAKYAMFYETSILFGGILGSCIYIFQIPIPFGTIFLIIGGGFGGIFVGCLIGALAEILKSLPILMNRIELKVGINYIIYGIAFGKSVGSLVQFFK